MPLAQEEYINRIEEIYKEVNKEIRYVSFSLCPIKTLIYQFKKLVRDYQKEYSTKDENFSIFIEKVHEYIKKRLNDSHKDYTNYLKNNDQLKKEYYSILLLLILEIKYLDVVLKDKESNFWISDKIQDIKTKLLELFTEFINTGKEFKIITNKSLSYVNGIDRSDRETFFEYILFEEKYKQYFQITFGDKTVENISDIIISNLGSV